MFDVLTMNICDCLSCVVLMGRGDANFRLKFWWLTNSDEGEGRPKAKLS